MVAASAVVVLYSLAGLLGYTYTRRTLHHNLAASELKMRVIILCADACLFMLSFCAAIAGIERCDRLSPRNVLNKAARVPLCSTSTTLKLGSVFFFFMTFTLAVNAFCSLDMWLGIQASSLVIGNAPTAAGTSSFAVGGSGTSSSSSSKKSKRRNNNNGRLGVRVCMSLASHFSLLRHKSRGTR